MIFSAERRKTSRILSSVARLSFYVGILLVLQMFLKEFSCV